MATPKLPADWISRWTIPDLYPRKDDPFRPGPAVVPYGAPAGSLVGVDELGGTDIYQGWVTVPGARPIVNQRAVSFQLTVGTVPVPLTPGQFQVDTFIINVPSTAANSVFFGYGGGISITSGIEIQAGIPLAIRSDNTREQWELQRSIERIAAMLGSSLGLDPPGPYRAPRVVFNSNEYFLVAAANTVVAVMLFYVPELQ